MRTPLSLRFSPSEVTLSGFAGGEYFPLPAEFGYCRYAVLQCCGLKDGIALRNNGALQKLRKLQSFMNDFSCLSHFVENFAFDEKRI